MIFSRIKISNFRSILEADISLNRLNCAIGHNNAGKSTLLMALSLFISGTKISSSDFYDKNNDVCITVTFDGLTEEILDSLADDHRDRIQELVIDSKLTLTRRYSSNGSGILRCYRRVFKDTRFRDEAISECMKGKAGAQLKAALVEKFPELTDHFEKSLKNTQAAYKQIISEFLAGQPEESYERTEADLPTGFDNSVAVLMPEVVYIPAVKDITDDVKTKETSSFGRILKILLELISTTEKIAEINESFNALQRMLNKTVDKDGVLRDERIEQVQRIESSVTKYIRDQFKNVDVDIEIPPPEMKTIFSNARIYLNDGVRGDIESKGDGLKRAVTFALLRTFVELRRDQRALRQQSTDKQSCRYLFLFEEPELYLHPNAQRILYDALVEISAEQQVYICTHSPYFFSANSTGTFLRLKKINGTSGSAPVSQALPVDITEDVTNKDAFQIICYENNTAAFFCDRVVLVEGDSDVIYLKHLSKICNPNWDFDRLNIPVIKIGGKGNFQRYRTFFNSFNVEVKIVADLDAIVDQYAKLGASDRCGHDHSALIRHADNIIKTEGEPVELTTKQSKSIAEKATFKNRYDTCKQLAGLVSSGH